MKLLASLSEVGVELAQMAGKQAREANWLGADGAVMYERIALAVRRTIALHTRLYAEARARQDRGAAEQARRAAMAREDARRRKEQVRHEVDAAIEAAGRRPDADPRETERLLRDLTERLDDPETEADFGDRPIGEIVAGICQDLGITPDMPQWPAALVAIDRAPGAADDCAQRRSGTGSPVPAGEVPAGEASAGRPPRVGTGREPP
jgi:hypothetical protein